MRKNSTREAKVDAQPEQVLPPAATPPKSATITLRGNGAVLTLVAARRPDGSAVTYVTTKGVNSTTERGMSEVHASFETAKAYLNVLADKAKKIGWERREFKPTARPDAFSKLPTVPKVAPKPETVYSTPPTAKEA